MPASYGVRCKKCGGHIHITEAALEGNHKIAPHTPPTEPIPCSHCGHVDTYGSKHHQFIKVRELPR